MKVHGAERPRNYTIDVYDDLAVVTLRENFTEIEPSDDKDGGFEFDAYIVETIYREDLEETIASNFGDWLADAKNQERKVLADRVRAVRDKLLNQSDRFVFPHNPLAEEKKDLWREYQHALRIIPEQEGFPYEVVFPTKPETNKGGS